MASVVGYQKVTGTWRETYNFSATVPIGTTRVVVLGGFEGSVSSQAATMSLGGTPMDLIGRIMQSSGTTRNGVYAFEIAFTSTGSQTLAMTQDGASSASHDGYLVYLADYDTDEASDVVLHTGTTASPSLTTLTDGALLLGFANWAISTTITVDSPSTAFESSDNSAGFTKIAGYQTIATAGSAGMGFTSPGSAVRGASVLVAFPPSTPPVPTSPYVIDTPGSGTFTAQETGWHLFRGFGGGASGGGRDTANSRNGSGGGGAAYFWVYKYLTIGDEYDYTVPAGGAAAAVDELGNDGGDLLVYDDGATLVLRSKGGRAGVDSLTGGLGGDAASCVGDGGYSGGDGNAQVQPDPYHDPWGFGGSAAASNADGNDATGTAGGAATDIGGAGGYYDTTVRIVATAPGGGETGSFTSASPTSGNAPDGQLTIEWGEGIEPPGTDVEADSTTAALALRARAATGSLGAVSAVPATAAMALRSVGVTATLGALEATPGVARLRFRARSADASLVTEATTGTAKITFRARAIEATLALPASAGTARLALRAHGVSGSSEQLSASTGTAVLQLRARSISGTVTAGAATPGTAVIRLRARGVVGSLDALATASGTATLHLRARSVAGALESIPAVAGTAVLSLRSRAASALQPTEATALTGTARIRLRSRATVGSPGTIAAVAGTARVGLQAHAVDAAADGINATVVTARLALRSVAVSASQSVPTEVTPGRARLRLRARAVNAATALPVTVGVGRLLLRARAATADLGAIDAITAPVVMRVRAVAVAGAFSAIDAVPGTAKLRLRSRAVEQVVATIATTGTARLRLRAVAVEGVFLVDVPSIGSGQVDILMNSRYHITVLGASRFAISAPRVPRFTIRRGGST